MVSKIPWYSIGRFALIVLCLAIVLVLVVTVLPIYLDITAFKGPVEEILSEVAEAPVTVGEIRLHPSLWPTLRVSGAEVAGSGGVDSPPFSRIERAEIKISLLPLLRKRLQLKRFLASEAIFYAHRPEGRGGNWPVSTTKAWEITELAGIELENVTIHLEDHQTVRATMVIDHLTCDIAKTRALDLELRGSLEGLPLSVSAAGPTLAATRYQASDFPLSLQLHLADLHLDLAGSASREPGGTRFQFTFDVSSDNFDFLRQLRGAEIPMIGGFELAGGLSNRNSTLEITDLEGSIGSTSVFGRLALDAANGRPDVSGRLSLGRLDLEPWLGSGGDESADPEAPLPFSILNTADASLRVTLKEIAGVKTKLADLSAEMELENGHLRVPTTLLAAGIPLSTDIEIQADQATPGITAQVSTRDLSMAQLRELIDVPERLEGHFSALDLDVATAGSTRRALRANLRIEATARHTALAILNETGESSLAIDFDQIRITDRPEAALTAAAQGQLFDETFAIDLETASLSDLTRNDTWPLSVKLHGAGATAGIIGTLEQEATGLDFDLSFDVSGDRLSDLEHWLGVSSDTPLPYAVEGRLTAAAGARVLRLDDAALGNSRLSGEIAWSPDAGDDPLMVDLHATTLDLHELIDPSSSITHLDTKDDVLAIDIPILPGRKRFRDAEIELTVDRLLRDTIDLTDIEAVFHFREGHPEQSSFSFAYDSQRLAGQLRLDLRQETPEFTLGLQGDGEELGEFLEKEGFVEGIEIAAQELDLRIDASGATVREIVQSADLSGQLVNVRWQIQPADFDEPVTIQLERLDLSGPAGKPIVLTAKGLLDQEPLDLRLTLRVPADLQGLQSRSIPFHFASGLAGTRVELDGEVELPITKAEFDMQMVVEGETLATLSAVMDTDLPDIGPYQLKSRLAVAEGSFALKELDLALGESNLRGEIGYSRVEDRPTFTADLTSQLIRIEDIFRLEPESEREGEEEAADDSAVQKPPETRKLTLDQFNGFDAAIKLAIRKILTSDGSTENMSFALNLERGSLDLIADRDLVSGETAQLTAYIRPWGQGIQTEVRAAWDRQPYGWVTEVLKPGISKGSWSLDLDLSSRGSSLRELEANLSGHLDFADYPADANATMFDLWGGGLLNSLLPVFQLGAESRINCAVAKFQVENGILTPDLLIIDSTRSRIRGKGTIDLPGDEIRLRLKPRPKQRSLINLATPVDIRGPLTDPNVQISTGGMAVTFFRLSLWVYTVWRDLVRRPLPTDGSDLCVDPFATPQKQKSSRALKRWAIEN